MSKSVAESVIDRFGGIRALAEALGHGNASTVQGWKERGRIPVSHWASIEALAAKRGWLDLTVLWLGKAHAEAAAAPRRTEQGAA